MAENKKLNPEEIEAIESSIAAELIKNDDIVDYIQPNSLELLKARYAAAEEDESIRNEGFEPIKKAGLIKKQRPESTAFDYFATPVSPKDEIRTDVDSPLSQVFDSTKSEFDADTASFSDIDVSLTAHPAPEAEPSAEEKKISIPEDSDTPAEFTVNPQSYNNRYGYNTHTRVIYVDSDADDDIQRNSDEELSSAFSADTAPKRRFSLWTKKKK